MSERVKLGVFELGGRIGEGGMGVVYRGRHRETGVEVAVKVLRKNFDEEANRKFEREVQQHAKLQHPRIVYLFEYGSVPESAVDRFEGKMTAGSPFVVMELADGTARDAMPFGSWRAVRGVVEQILDGLAHAHARDVIHRDLKPENFLVFDSGGDGESRLKLADFGIAHAIGEEDERTTGTLVTAAGTPMYMAPEQAKGRWRNYGPWTDLYTVGCITWEFVCGEPPFSGSSTFKTLMMHQRRERPPLEPMFPIPEALERWIHKAMAREPSERFQCAADAMRSLAEVGWVESEEVYEGESESATGGESVDDGRGVPGETETSWVGPTLTATISSPGAGPGVDADVEVRVESEETGSDTIGLEAWRESRLVPPQWERTVSTRVPTPLVGTGLGLFDLRDTPFVNRDVQRDQIWETLREVERTGKSRVVMIAGETGVGKTRLAEWMAIRANEVGAANILRAYHTGGGAGPREGLRGTVRRAVRGQKLSRSEFFEHLMEWLPELDDAEVRVESDAAALTEFVFPTEASGEQVDGPRYQFSSEGQQYALLARLIRRYGPTRPSYVLVDDAQWGAFAVRMVRHLMREEAGRPGTLVVMTVETDAVTEASRAGEDLRGLLAHERCRRIELERLDSEDHREFVDRLLPLQAESRERLASRTEGNPMFAVQSLRSLLEDDELHAGTSGFRISPEAASKLPENVQQVWLRRVGKLVDGLASDDREREVVWQAIEVAATLGREVTFEEWRAICEGVGIGDEAGDLRRALVRRGLVEAAETRGVFSHGLLVESLQRRAREGGRWEAHNRRCAQLLAALYAGNSVDALVRRASHWVEAGKPKEALRPLMEAYAEWRRLGEYERGLEVLERRAQVIEQMGIEEDDPRAIENVIESSRCRMAIEQDRSEAVELLKVGRDRAQKIGNDRLLAKGWVAQAWEHRMGAEFKQAAECCERAVEAGERAGEADEVALAYINLGWAKLSQNETSAAVEAFEAGLEVAESAKLTMRRIMGKRGLATVALTVGDSATALELLEPILAESREKGLRLAELQCLNGVGEARRLSGDIPGAREAYTRCLELAREVNQAGYETNCWVNLAQVYLAEGRLDKAREGLRKARSGLEKESRLKSRQHILRLAEAAWAVGVGHWERFDDLMSHYEGGLPSEARIVRDHPWLLEIAGSSAREAGEASRARMAWALARDLWEVLQNDAGIQRVTRWLGDLEDSSGE